MRLGPGLTVVTGPNGAGKTNLLEAIYFACTGRSCRTANEREVVRFGAGVTRLELDAERDGESHRITVGFEPGEAKRLQVDGATVDRLTDAAARPLVSVFLPDRLELVLGAPALRRAHLDQVIAALWPARVGHAPRLYRRARPAQRAAGGDPRRPRRPQLAAGVGPRAGPPRRRPGRRPGCRGRVPGRAVRHARRGARAGGRRGAHLPAAVARRDPGGAGRRARRAHRLRPRARLHRPRPAPRRAGAQARRPRAAHLRLARPAAPRPARAAAGGARRPGRRARGRAADAARRRHVRARLAAPRAAGGGAARGRRPERDRDHRPRARAGRRRRGRRAPQRGGRDRGGSGRGAAETVDRIAA